MSALTLGSAPIPNAVSTPGEPSELRQPPVFGGLMLPHGHGPLAAEPSPKHNGVIWLHAGFAAKVTRTTRTPSNRISFMGLREGFEVRNPPPWRLRSGLAATRESGRAGLKERAVYRLLE